MTLLQNGAEGYADGATVTVGSSGGLSGDPWTDVVAGTGTITASTEQLLKGNVAYKMAPGSASVQYLEWITNESSQFAWRFYLYMPTLLPVAGQALMVMRNLGGGQRQIVLAVEAGPAFLHVKDKNGVNILWTSTQAIEVCTWYRIEGFVTNGGPTTGTFSVQTYIGDSLTPIAALSTTDLTGHDFGIDIGRIWFGFQDGVSTVAYYFLDDLAVRDGSTVLIGPSSGISPGLPAAHTTRSGINPV